MCEGKLGHDYDLCFFSELRVWIPWSKTRFFTPTCVRHCRGRLQMSSNWKCQSEFGDFGRVWGWKNGKHQIHPCKKILLSSTHKMIDYIIYFTIQYIHCGWNFVENLTFCNCQWIKTFSRNCTHCARYGKLVLNSYLTRTKLLINWRKLFAHRSLKRCQTYLKERRIFYALFSCMDALMVLHLIPGISMFCHCQHFDLGTTANSRSQHNPRSFW